MGGTAGHILVVFTRSAYPMMPALVSLLQLQRAGGNKTLNGGSCTGKQLTSTLGASQDARAVPGTPFRRRLKVDHTVCALE